MASEEKIGVIYMEVRARQDLLQADIAKLKSDYAKTAKGIEDRFQKAKLNFDNSLAKKKISELRDLQAKLQAQFQKKIDLNVSARSLDLTRQKLQMVESQLGGIDQKAGFLSTTFGKVATAIGGMFALQKIIGFMRDSVNEARDAVKTNFQIKQAVEQTGYAAGFTATQLKNMASEFGEALSVDTEDILINLTQRMLTFTNIAGESFKRAQQAALDMNAVLGGGNLEELGNQALVLGKALDAPREGLDALSRVGVRFTEQEKKLIESLVKSGDLLKAQDVILKKVEERFGGQAKALAEADKGVRTFIKTTNDLKESAGKVLLPILTKSAEGWKLIFDLAGQAADKVKKFFDKNYDKKRIEAAAAEQKKAAEAQLAILKAKTNTEKVLTDEEIEALKKAAEEKKAATQKYFDAVKWMDGDYKAFRIRMMNEEIADMKKKGATEIDVETYKYVKMKELYRDYLDTIKSMDLKTRTGASKTTSPTSLVPEIAGGSGMVPGAGQMAEGFIPGQDFITYRDVGLASFAALNEGMAAMYEKWQIFSDSTIQSTSSGFVQGTMTMLNAFTRMIEEMIARYLAFKAVVAVGNLILPGLGTSIGAFIGGKEGGEFVGTSSGVKAAFAGGGEFTVPMGFNNDSFPMWVQSGERVSVTPAGKQNKEAALLESLLKATHAQTMTIAMQQSRLNKLEVTAGAMSGRDIQLVVEKEQRISDRIR